MATTGELLLLQIMMMMMMTLDVIFFSRGGEEAQSSLPEKIFRQRPKKLFI